MISFLCAGYKEKKEEAAPGAIAAKEEWAKGLCYCDMEGFAIEEDGTLILLDECGKQKNCPEGRFEIVWEDSKE